MKWINNQKGWVLPDSIVAMVILAVGIVAAGVAYSAISKNIALNDRYNNGMVLAKQEVDALKLQDGLSFTMPSGHTVVKNNTTYTVSYGNATVSETLSVNIRPVLVTVSWVTNKNKSGGDVTSKIELVGYHYE